MFKYYRFVGEIHLSPLSRIPIEFTHDRIGAGGCENAG